MSWLPAAGEGCKRHSQRPETHGGVAGPSQPLTARALPLWVFKPRGMALCGKAWFSLDNSSLRQGRCLAMPCSKPTPGTGGIQITTDKQRR